MHERGRRQAAEELLPRHLAIIRGRGCQEEYEARPDLLDEGLVRVSMVGACPHHPPAGLCADIHGRRRRGCAGNGGTGPRAHGRAHGVGSHRQAAGDLYHPL